MPNHTRNQPSLLRCTEIKSNHILNFRALADKFQAFVHVCCNIYDLVLGIPVAIILQQKTPDAKMQPFPRSASSIW